MAILSDRHVCPLKVPNADLTWPSRGDMCAVVPSAWHLHTIRAAAAVRARVYCVAKERRSGLAGHVGTARWKRPCHSQPVLHQMGWSKVSRF